MTSNELDIEKLKGISALLIHAAKIDENYTEKEKNIISNFLKKFFKEDQKMIDRILKEAEIIENDSNQLLSFTNIIKKNSLESKAIIIKELWKIILSDETTDEFESNLIRRICGLIYFPDKESGEIKIKVKEEIKLK
jgi:uncharacterized tellurite resistance protein B-like protein